MASLRAPRARTRRHRQAVLKQALIPERKWNDCRFTVQISYIDPCSPMTEFHTDSKPEALKTWLSYARFQDKRGGEWSVDLFEHPKDRAPTRKTYRRDGPGGFVYQALYPRSRKLKSHDYMQPKLTDANT